MEIVSLIELAALQLRVSAVTHLDHGNTETGNTCGSGTASLMTYMGPVFCCTATIQVYLIAKRFKVLMRSPFHFARVLGPLEHTKMLVGYPL